MLNNLWGWFSDILVYIGLKYKSVSLLFLGLDYAGKTTLIHVLASGSLKAYPPTRYSTKEEVVIGSIKFSCIDLGGHQTVRRTWKTLFLEANAIVFIIDATNTERLSEAMVELHKLLSTEEIAHLPVLVLGNKIDLPRAISEKEFRQGIGLEDDKTTGKETSRKDLESKNIRPIEVFMCSNVLRVGYGDGLKWLSQFV